MAWGPTPTLLTPGARLSARVFARQTLLMPALFCAVNTAQSLYVTSDF